MSVNKDQVKKLYDATSQDYGLTNFELFVQSLNDDVKRKEFFDLANVKYDIGNTLEEFENNLGIKKKILAEEPIQPNLDKPLIQQEEPKAKAGGLATPQQPSVSLEPTVPSPSVSPLVSEPLKALKGADQTKISARAKELGLDSQALTAAINDFEGDDDVIVNKAKEFATNRAEYDKSKAAYTWRNMLKTTMKNSGVSDDEANIKIDYVTKLQQLDIDPQTGQTIPAGYAGSLERVSKIRDVIKENITNEGDRQEALRALNVDAYAALYQGMKDQNAVNGWAKTGNGNVFVGAGLDMLRLTDPDRAKTLAERIQNQYATNEDKALYLRELENIGLNAIAFEVNRNLNRVSQSDKKPSETFVSALNNWKSLAEKTKASQINRYGDITGADIDRMLFDVTEGLETSTGEKAIYNVAAGASDWLERGLSGIWDYATKNREERLASDMKRDHSKYITEDILNYADTGSSMREAAFIPKLVDPEIKKQVEEVMANTSLDRDEKYKSVYPLIKNAYLNGGIEFFSNPNKGNLNLTSKNILHLVSTSGARSIGNVIPAVMTGGGASTALIAGLDAAAMKYDEQFREGSNDPLARSLRTGLTVGALAGIMDEAAALSKAFKGGSASLVAKPTALGAAKSFGTMLGREEVEELATEALDGDVVKNWKEVVLSTAIIAPIFAGPTAIIDNRRSSDMYRQLWFEAGSSPELAKNGLNRMLNEGAINNTQFNEASKRVDRMAQIVANMPKTDMKGQPLSDSQKAKYADNLMKKYDAQSIPDTLPTKVAEQITADAQQADAENASILEGEVATDLSITEDKTTEQISKQDQIKQKNEFITDADFVQEAFTPEEDAADREALPESQFKTEEELSDFLANGQYAMLTGQNPEATPLSKDANRKLNEKAQQWLSSRGLTAVPIFGKYGNSERSFMVPNMTKRQAVEFAKEFQQESVAHSSGLVYQDGSFNPRTEGVDLSPRFDQGGDFFSTINVGGKKVDFSINYDFDTKVEPKKALYESLRKRMFGDVGQKVASAQKALEKTGVVINMVQDPAEFDRTVAQFGGQKGVEGVFVSDQGKIFINQTKLDQGIADGRVIWHESSHPVVNIIRNTNRQLFDKVVSGLKQASQNNKGVMDALTWAETNYAQDGQGVVDDEAVVETIAGIAEGTIDIQALPTGVKQSIIEFINRIATALGFDPVLNDTDVAAFKKLASDVANALSTGQDISEIVGAENVKDYLNTVEAPGIVTGGELNKATQSRVTAEPAVNVYASKEVSALPQKSLTEIYEQFGGKSVVINSDPTRVGTLTLPSGKTIFMYGGPAYLSVKDNVDGNVGFATTQISKVNTWMNYVKEVFGDQPGVTLVASQAPTSILSNSYALRYVMDGISQLPKSVLKSSDFKNEFFGKDLVLLKDAFGDKAYNEFVNKYKKADLSNPEVIDAMIAEMAYKVGDDNKPASFKARGAFVSNLLGGLAEKASLKGVEGDKGYVSKKPNKFIAKQLMDRLGINAEKVMREIGEPSLVEQYMNEGNWGFAVAGFETDPSLTVESVQNGGVKHPLFNAKFPGKSPFILDGAYDLDQMFTPVEMTGPSGMPYTKTASQMLAGSMYVKGQPISGQGSFEYKNVSPSGRRIQSSKGNRVTRAMDNVSNQMTEDGQGNYVFYHYSNNDLKKIDPSKFGRNIATGRDERPGVGLSMYYTRPDVRETMVPSDFGYVVRIPKDKVYPFNEDPLNLLQEAEKQFKKQFPDQAFDFNKQVGFVTKVAADRGYPMTVAEWNVGRKKALRAQTTESMKPEKFKEKVFDDGYMQEKINPKLDFVPNAKKRVQMSKGNRLAPNGKPSNLNEKQYQQVRTPEFKAWFGDWENDPANASKVVDENGEPMVMWHKSTSIEPFSEFDKKYINKNDPDFWSNGFWFSRDIENTAAWTRLGGKGFVASFFLNVRNILKNDKIDEYEKAYEDEIEENDGTSNRLNLIKRGYDGVEFEKIINPIPIVNQVLNRNEKIDIDRKSYLQLGKINEDLVYKYIDNGQFVDAIYLDTYDGKKLEKQTLDYQLSKIEDLIREGVIIAFEPNQIKSATDNKGTFSTTDNRIQASKGNRISTDTQIIDGFYSPIENRVNDFKQPKASATKWKEIVGVKSDEAVFSGLSDWLNSQKPDAQLSKQDVLNFMKGNRIQIKEVTKRDTRTDATKYSQYQLPGGENYKEVLITLPGKDQFKSSHFDETNIITHLRMNTRTDADGKKVLFLEEVQSDWGQKGKREGFEDLNKQNLAAKKQSLMNQYQDLDDLKGKDRTLEVAKKKTEILDEIKSVNKELGLEVDDYRTVPIVGIGIAKAPFVTNTNAWVKLGLKYALKEAVRQGADRIAWTTGSQQNERYSLSKSVDSIQYAKTGDDSFLVSVTGKNGEEVLYNTGMSLKDVEATLGKDIADKINSGFGEEEKAKQRSVSDLKSLPTIKGEGLEVGGKGMKAFYGDAQNPGIVANVAKALVKELTGKEGEVVPSKISSQRNQDVIDRYNRARQYGNIPEALAKEYEQAQGLDSEQPAIEITPALRQEVKAGMPQFSMGNRDNEIRQFIRENIGQYSPDEISQAIQDELGISKADADAMVADESKGQAPLAEEIQTFQAGTGEEQERAMADQFEGLAPEVESQIDEDARTYFAKTNKQTDEEVDNFIKGKDMADLSDYVVSNPNIPGRVKIWMAAKVAKNLGRDIEAARANGDQAEVARLSEKQANIYNTFAREATELGQAVQAFVAFNDDPNAVNFFLNKILRQLKENGVESITDQQRNDLIGLMQAVNNARPGLPKNKAIIQLSHYLGRLAPVKIGDVMQSIWYAHILSGVTTQLKNIYANTTMLALELPIGATWQSMKNRSLMPFVYAFKGLGAGLAKGIVKGADILRSGVTEKDANKFFGTEPVLEYFSWKQTKLGKLGGGDVGKFLDFPLFIGISPKTLKMVGRALAGADAFFSTTAQEAMANMLAYNQAVAEGKSGITPNGYRRVQELLGNTKQTIQDSEATAVSEGFKPGTIEYKRRVIELVTQTRNEQNQVAAEEFGKRVTLTNEPEGFTRGIYQVATAIQQYMPISRVVIPFTRIVSNISEMIINYSPAGAYRALTGIKNPKLSFKFSPTGDNKLSDEARGELFLKSSMAIAAVALLMDNVGDDEDDWFDITGGGPTDFQKKYELMKGGWRPYTITLKNGKKINYADWPIAGALSGLGTMRDIQQYEKEDVKKNESRLGLAAYGYLTAFYDKSLIKGISDFVDLFRLKGKYGPDATSLEKFEKFMANQAKALSMTNFSQQVFKMIQEYNDDPIKEAKGWESLYRDLPVLNDGLNPIIDVFGDPVTPSTSERLLPYMTVKDEKKDAMIEMINKKGIFIGIPEQKPFVELDTRTEREMTRDELYRYRKMAGEYTKAILLNRIDDISKAADKYEGEFKQKAWEKMIGNAVSAARKRAYVDLLMNKKTDINKLFEDLNQE